MGRIVTAKRDEQNRQAQANNDSDRKGVEIFNFLPLCAYSRTLIIFHIME